jgi:ABC-type transport system substrate-binding protein
MRMAFKRRRPGLRPGQGVLGSLLGDLSVLLVRTLISFNGQEAEEGGNEPRPDLAVDLPGISEDGLTYTFRIKDGVRVAPPFDDVEVTAQDFVRVIEREACDGVPRRATRSTSM